MMCNIANASCASTTPFSHGIADACVSEITANVVAAVPPNATVLSCVLGKSEYQQRSSARYGANVDTQVNQVRTVLTLRVFED